MNEIHELDSGEHVPARREMIALVRNGVSNFDLNSNQKISKQKIAIMQFRAARALGYGKAKILKETGWSLQWYLQVEALVHKQDRRYAERQVDPAILFAEYKEKQMLAVRELEDLTVAFRESKQYSALVTAIRTRSEILDKILKTGQDLGVIARTAKEFKISGQIDYRSMSLNEIRVALDKEMGQFMSLLGGAEERALRPAARAALSKVLPPTTEPTPRELRAQKRQAQFPRPPRQPEPTIEDAKTEIQRRIRERELQAAARENIERKVIDVVEDPPKEVREVRSPRVKRCL